MLQNKDINKISELKNGFTPRWLEPDFILSSLKCFSFSALCKCLNILKKRGYSFESLFSCLICLPFLGLKTVHSFTGSILSSHMEILERVLNDEKAYQMINRLLQCELDMKNAA